MGKKEKEYYTQIEAGGIVTIPEVLKELNIKEGSYLECELSDDNKQIILRKASDTKTIQIPYNLYDIARCEGEQRGWTPEESIEKALENLINTNSSIGKNS